MQSLHKIKLAQINEFFFINNYRLFKKKQIINGFDFYSYCGLWKKNTEKFYMHDTNWIFIVSQLEIIEKKKEIVN